jgi:hypothetical protein
MTRTKGPEEQLSSFIAKFLPEIGAQAEAILGIMRRRYPTALELVYDNYNALAIGFSPTEKTSQAIFSIALYPRWVSLFFLQARGLHDPAKLLRGGGNVVRYVVLTSPRMLNDPAIEALMQEAVERAKVPFNPAGAHRLIIKSISPRQRPRRPAVKVTPKKAPAAKAGEKRRALPRPAQSVSRSVSRSV